MDGSREGGREGGRDELSLSLSPSSLGRGRLHMTTLMYFLTY